MRIDVSFVGVVLAGGRSSRMGQDKAGLLLQGETFLQRATAALCAAGASQVWVSGSHDGYNCIADSHETASIGPLAGIASTLAKLPDGLVLFVAVDMPGVDAEVLQRLLRAARGSRSAAFVREPLPWVVDVDEEVRAELEQLLHRESSQRSIRALQSSLDTVEIEVPPQIVEKLRNVNAPQDLAQLTAHQTPSPA